MTDRSTSPQPPARSHPPRQDKAVIAHLYTDAELDDFTTRLAEAGLRLNPAVRAYPALWAAHVAHQMRAVGRPDLADRIIQTAGLQSR